MDRTNCSGLTATDAIFQHTPVGSCGSSLVGYIFVCGSILLMGLIATLKKWRDYWKRRQNGLRASVLVPMLLSALTVLEIITVILAGTNTINASNGLSFTAVSCYFAVGSSVVVLSYLRLVRATGRMLRFLSQNDNQSSNVSAKQLSKVDKWGLIAVLLASLCAVLATVALAVFSPLYPDYQSAIGLIAWNLRAGHYAAFSGALIWQSQRCAMFVQCLEAEGASKATLKQLMRIIRIRQLGYIASGSLYVLYQVLLATKILPWEWWAVMGIQIFLDMSSIFYFAFTTKAKQVSTLDRTVTSLFSKDALPRSKPKLFKELGASGFLGTDDLTRLPSHAEMLDRAYRFMEGEMQIGCETVVYYIWGKEAARRIARFTENPIITFIMALFGVVHVGLAQCHLVMLEECVPNPLLYSWSVFGMLMYVGIAASRISLPIARQVLRTPSFWLRFLTIIILFLCMLDVVAFDERSLTITITTILISFCLFVDAFIGNSTLYRIMIYCLVVPLPMINLAFLQFDILANRRNTVLPLVQTASFNYSWSVYQMALDSNYSLFFILFRDAFKAIRRSEYFIYLEAPIYARIKPMDFTGARPTSMMVNAQDIHMALHHGGIIVSGDQGVHYVDRIVMREDDAIAVHVLGKERVKIWFAFWGNVYVRSITKILVGVTFLTCTIGALPEVWPKEAVLAEIYTLVVLLVAIASFKSWTMLKLLMRRLDFWIDAFLVALVFVAGAVVFAEDVRIFTFILCFIAFLDERTFDARVVNFSNPKRSFGGIVLVISLVFLLCSILSLVVVFNLGFISSINKEAAIVFRSVDESSLMVPPSGTFARLRLIQFAASGLTAFAMYQGLQQLSNFWRSKEDGFRLQWLSAPILKRYVTFAERTNPVAIRQSVDYHHARAPSRVSVSATEFDLGIPVDVEEQARPLPLMGRAPSLQEMSVPGDESPAS